MAAAKTFWTSFLDGLTGAGIFGDLRIPGDPVRLFKEDPREIALSKGIRVPPFQVEGVNVDVNGEVVNIARDREKGWVVVSEPTTRAAR